MKVIEASTLVVELIEMGRFEDGVAVGRNIPKPLIISKNKEDIRVFAREAIGTG